jgi:hypothetical protein
VLSRSSDVAGFDRPEETIASCLRTTGRRVGVFGLGQVGGEGGVLQDVECPAGEVVVASMPGRCLLHCSMELREAVHTAARLDERMERLHQAVLRLDDGG